MHAHVHARLKIIVAAGLVATALVAGFTPTIAEALETPPIPETRTANEIVEDVHDRRTGHVPDADVVEASPAVAGLISDVDELTPPEDTPELVLAEEEAEETSEPPADAKTPEQVAIETGLAQIGKPYRWGATGPNAFDCSGFTGYAWAAAGVSLPRTSRAQYAGTQRVALDEMQPGDLVFSGYSTITHVGLYIGDGMMVHSPRSGRTVEVSPLHSNLIGAGRPHP